MELERSNSLDDRLWAELIFPWCRGRALLLLRAVCRVFRAQLNNSLLLLPLVMELPQLRYDERIDGWRGVERGMQREANTRANCATGRFAIGLELPRIPHVIMMLHVAGRIAVFYRGLVKIELYALDTGELVASFDVRLLSVTHIPNNIVTDRWIAFCDANNRGLLLDCLTARMVEFSRYCNSVIVAGSCIAYHICDAQSLTVVRLCGRPDGTTGMREVACMERVLDDHSFALCEHAESYVLLDQQKRTVQLLELASHKVLRVIDMRTCGPPSPLLSFHSRRAAADFEIDHVVRSVESEFVLLCGFSRFGVHVKGKYDVVACRLSGNVCATVLHSTGNELTRAQMVIARLCLRSKSFSRAVSGAVYSANARLATMTLSMQSRERVSRVWTEWNSSATRRAHWHGLAMAGPCS